LFFVGTGLMVICWFSTAASSAFTDRFTAAMVLLLLWML